MELKWFCNYLSDHLQRVKYNNGYSDWGSVLGGIPQGSVLGPPLFLVYVNDMPLQVENGDLVQFADDICIICSGRTHKEVSEILCNDLCSLSSWTIHRFKLSFSQKFFRSKGVYWWNSFPSKLLHKLSSYNQT